MKLQTFVPNDRPKSKKSALALAAHIAGIEESIERRKIVLKDQSHQHSVKIEYLQKKLQAIEAELLSIKDKNPATEYIEGLMLEFNLTRAEILETRSEILRRSIESQSKARDSVLKQVEITVSELQKK